jgi:hypothetical protein
MLRALGFTAGEVMPGPGGADAYRFVFSTAEG